MSSSSSSPKSSSSSSWWTSAIWMDFAAGWCSDAMAVVCCQPIDTLLTRYQVQSVCNSATTTSTTTTSVVKQYANFIPRSIWVSSSSLSSSSPWALARHDMVLTQPRILWRGSACMASAVPFQNALLLTGYGWGKQVFDNNDDNDPNNHNNKKLLGIFLGGLIGGMLQSFVTSPVEWIKVQQQVAGMSNNTTVSTATIPSTSPTGAMVGNNGSFFSRSSSSSPPPPPPRSKIPTSSFWKTTSPIAALSSSSCTTTTTVVSTWGLLRQLMGHPWRGLNATLWRDGIPHGVWFGSYELCKDYVIEEYGCDTVTTSLISGAVAATVAWAVGYPFDLIKTRIQAVASSDSSTGTKNPPSSQLGVWAMARQIIKEGSTTKDFMSTSIHSKRWSIDVPIHSIMALYRGFGWKLLRAIPASMIGFTTYEFVLQQLQQQQNTSMVST